MPRKMIPCSVCDQPMHNSSTSRPEGIAAHNSCRASLPKENTRTCKDCAKTFTVGARSAARCNPCRYIRAKATADRSCAKCNKPATAKGMCSSHYSSEYIAKHGRKNRPKGESRPCAICGQLVDRAYASTGTAPMHKQCRVDNPGKAARIKRGLPLDDFTPRGTNSFRRKIAKAAEGTDGGKRVFVAGGCAWCGEYFVAAAGVYCSDGCKVSAKFKRRSSGKSFSVSPRVRQEIYARDRWTCQICSHPVDVAAKHPSHWAPTLDHVIPQSAMLLPDHSPSNLRLAHSWCNSARGDGSNMAKDVLIARATAMHMEAA